MCQGAAMLRTTLFAETIQDYLHLTGIHIGRDGSVIRVGEGVYDITHRRFLRVVDFVGEVVSRESNFDRGYWCVWVTSSLNQEVVYGWCSVETILSTLRGPVFRAVQRLQRAFREKRYMQRYNENKGWDNFIDCVVAWVESGGRYFRKSKFSPFSPTPTWGYAPASAIAGAPSWAARDPADVDAEPAGAESDIGVRRRSRSRSRPGPEPEQFGGRVGGRRSRSHQLG